MSRGLGWLQRRMLYALSEEPPEGGLRARDLKSRTGADHANIRRAVRSLVRRGLVEEAEDGEGNKVVQLTGHGPIATRPLHSRHRIPSVSGSVPPSAEWTGQLEQRRRSSWKNASKESLIPRHRLSSCRPLDFVKLGSIQKRILAALQEHAGPTGEGLPVRALKALVGGDKGNARRAIRSLLARGLVEESDDGRHLRLTLHTSLLFTFYRARTKSWYRGRRGRPPGCRLSWTPYDGEDTL